MSGLPAIPEDGDVVAEQEHASPPRTSRKRPGAALGTPLTAPRVKSQRLASGNSTPASAPRPSGGRGASGGGAPGSAARAAAKAKAEKEAAQRAAMQAQARASAENTKHMRATEAQLIEEGCSNEEVARNSLMRPNMSWATEQRREQAVQRVMNASAAKQPRRDVTTDDIVKGRTMGKQDVSKPSGTPSHPAGKPSGGGKGSRGGRGKPSGGGLIA